VTGVRVATLACAFGVLALACTKATNGNPPLQPSGTGGFGGTGIMPPPPSGDVKVEIQSPAADLVAPSSSLVDVTVHAYVDSGSDVIDNTSVTATVTAKGDSSMLDSTKLAPDTTNADIYNGRISIGDLATGDYTLTVSATSSGGHRGVTSLDFKVDGGPILIVRSPVAAHSYKGLLVVEVYADPGLDPPLDGPHATVANYDVPLSQVLDTSGNAVPNVYRGSINLDDPVPGMTVEQLRDEQLLTVWAANARGKRVEVQLVFVIDLEGPTITQTTPTPGEMVGDFVKISATVTDPSGVLDSSVIAVVGDDTTPAKFNVQLKPDGGNSYSVLFDTRKLTQCPDPPSPTDLCIIYPTVSFRASDQLGNERALGYVFSVDNIAPVADMDPPKLRSFKRQLGYACSWEFDPLDPDGNIGDVPNDGKKAPQVFDLRARIEDDGNHANGLKGPPISLVDPSKTAVYVLDDETKALIVDTDGDGWCDSINPLLIPTTQPPTTNDQVLKIKLAPVRPGGAADFTEDDSLPDVANASSFCHRGIDPDPPKPMCGYELPIAIGYLDQGAEPAIWTLEDINPEWCFGRQFDALANNIHEGWACIAVATADNADNYSVSPPLRVDIQYTFNGAFNTPGSGTPPACTGTYDAASNTVTPGPCKTRRFERQLNKGDYYCDGVTCPGPFLPLP
jgi:hypothetical protein